MRTYRTWIKETSERNKSTIVLALDLLMAKPRVLLSRCLTILQETAPSICAIKLNRQVVLPLGLRNGVQKIVKIAHKLDLPTIMDCKINDVEHTNKAITEHYFNAGFDAITASPFVGWEGGLKPVFQLAEQGGKGVILLVYMSHRGAEEGYGQKVVHPKTGRVKFQYEVFAEKALEWKADGVIVGATFPYKIKEIHKILGGAIPIYSPGVILQGGKIREAIKAGATYLIIGRAICESTNPSKAAANIKEEVNRILGR